MNDQWPLRRLVRSSFTPWSDIEFLANHPGMWLFHSHNLVRMMGGLKMEVR